MRDRSVRAPRLRPLTLNGWVLGVILGTLSILGLAFWAALVL
jgi:hypothetical protein